MYKTLSSLLLITSLSTGDATVDVWCSQLIQEISPMLIGSGDEMDEEFNQPGLYELIDQSGIPLLRMGGIANEYYDWEGNDYNGQRYIDFIDSMIYVQNVETSLDDFLCMCEEIDIEPILSVNFQINDPGKAARMVEYCNGDQTTPMGQIRAERGHPEPYNVELWTIGNEPDISGFTFPVSIYLCTFYRHFAIPFEEWNWQDSVFVTPDQFAELVGVYVDSMRARSPIPIQIAGISLSDELTWLETVIEQNVDEMDWIDVHYYPCWYMSSQPPDTTDYINWLSSPDTGPKPLEEWYGEVLETVLSASGGIEIPVCVMEYNALIISPDPVWWNYLDGLFIADCLGHLARVGCPMAAVYSIYEGEPDGEEYPTFGMIRGDTISVRATAWVIKLHNDQFSGTLVDVTCDATGGGYGLEVRGSLRMDGTLCLMAVNKLLDQPIQTTINLHDFVSTGQAKVWDITNDAPIGAPWNGTTGIQYQGTVQGSATCFDYNFPSASVTCMVFSPDTAGIEGQAVYVPGMTCYPNPSSGTMEFNIEFPSSCNVTFVVYDNAGRRQATVFDGLFDAGTHIFTWDRRGADGFILPNGTYILVAIIDNKPAAHLKFLLW